MVLLGESRMPSAVGVLISPAANIAHGFLWSFSCGCAEGSCCFQDTGAAAGATVFPAAVPLCSEAGSPNSAAGKERSNVSTNSSRQAFSPSYSPPTVLPLSSICGHTAGYPIHWDLCKSVALYIPWENQISQWVTPHSKLFGDNWSFPVCKTQEVHFKCTVHNVLLLQTLLSNVPHSQAKTTVQTYILSSHKNVEWERSPMHIAC